LARKIRKLINNPPQIRQMSANSAQLARKDAAGCMVTTMEKYISHEGQL